MTICTHANFDEYFETCEDCGLTVKERLEQLRLEIQSECISYGEIAELQALSHYIEPEDTLLLEWAGVPEFEEAVS